MDTEIDWQRELDAAIGSGDDAPPAHFVAVGHTAVRRRRASFSAAGVAAAVVIGLAWTLGPGGAVQGEAPVATDPSPTSSPTGSTTPPLADERPWRVGDAPARTTPTGLQVRPGAVVHERRDDLYPGKDTESVALDLSYDGTRWWVVLEWDDGGASEGATRVQDAEEPSFDAFVRAEVRAGGMTHPPASDAVDFLGGPAALTFDGLVLAPGAGPVLQQVANPMGYTASQGRSVAIRVMFKGREHYSLMALFADGSSTISNDASGDFEAWLAQAVQSQHSLDVRNGLALASDEELDPIDWMELGPDGQVRSADFRVSVLEDRDADLGDSFGQGHDRTGVVRLRVDDGIVFAAYRITGRTLEVVPGGGGFDSLDAFVTWARSQYASGQGLR
jgi:hypothetical protein